MPKAHTVLVGVSAVDTAAAYYSTRLPGFDGRAGCEGVPRDIQRMEGLTHFLGYELLVHRALMDAQASRARFLAALALAAHPSSGLVAGDIFCLYASCHGQTLGEGPSVKPRSSMGLDVGFSVNNLLLYDAPIYNFEIFAELLPLIIRGVRVFTIFDSCHSGMGTSLQLSALTGAATAMEAFVRRLEVLFNLSLYIPLQAQLAALTTQVTTAALQAFRQALLIELTKGPVFQNYRLSQIKSLEKSDTIGVLPGLIHFGAVRDEGRAKGGFQGSLFTTRLHQLYSNGGDQMTYVNFFHALEAVMPASQPPVFEFLNIPDFLNGRPTGSPTPPANHFASVNHVFQI